MFIIFTYCLRKDGLGEYTYIYNHTCPLGDDMKNIQLVSSRLWTQDSSMTSIPADPVAARNKNCPSHAGWFARSESESWEAAKHRQAVLEAQTLTGRSSSSCETAGNQSTPDMTVGPTMCSQTTSSKCFRKYSQAEPLVESLPERPKHRRRLRDPETSLWQ